MTRQFVASLIIGLALLTGVAVYAASSAPAHADGPLCPICRIILGH